MAESKGPLRNPDRMVFDLDPSEEDFGSVVLAAQALKGLLEEMDLAPFVMTTGSRGLHVVVPLDGSADFPTVRAFAQNVASVLVSCHPRHLTIEQRKDRRGAVCLWIPCGTLTDRLWSLPTRCERSQARR
jgi:bifunctional non-homologous end joining protein LigD